MRTICSHSLIVCEAESENYPEIIRTLTQWEGQAAECQSEHKSGRADENARDFIETANSVAFVANALILELRFAEELGEVAFLENHQVVVSLDENEQIEGVMLLSLEKTKKIVIDWICVHPKNLGIIHIGEIFQRKGVGRALVEYTKDLCLEGSYKKVECSSRNSAQSFYSKMGFKPEVKILQITREKIIESRLKCGEPLSA